MPTYLVYVAQQGDHVQRASLEVLSHVRGLAKADGAALAAVVVGPNADALVEGIKAYGPETIYTVTDEAFAQHLNTPLLDALEAAVAEADPSLVAFASSEAVKDVLGALAVRTDAGVVSDVVSFSWKDDGVEALRPVMASKFMERVRVRAGRVLVSVRSGSFDASEAPADARVVALDVDFKSDDLRPALREVVSAAHGAVDLNEARVVVSAGRGVRDEAGRQLIEELAGVLDAAIGSSRAVVESGLFPASTQVGQTGKVVSPDLYFAIGISGAIQHTAGMANSRVIVAINKDPDAPIFKYATYGLVGDLYKILPPLIEALKESSNG